MESLKKIVNEVFLVDIEVTGSKRSCVDARKVYSKILKEIGYSYQFIGDTIGRDHSTIIHYVKGIDDLLTYDALFNKRFNICKKKFLLENRKIIMKSDDNIHLTVIDLAEKLEMAEMDKNKSLENFVIFLEEYEKAHNKMPSTKYCREVILPLFDS
jgi:hypothetical protein